MKILTHKGFSNKLLVLLATLIHAGSLLAATGYESISSNQPEYMPGDTATISGVGFEPNQSIKVQVIRVDGSIVKGDGTETPGSDTIIADSTGHFAYSYLLAGGATDVYNGTMTANAIDSNSGSTLASTTFIDGDKYTIQGCDENDPHEHCNPDNSSAGWAGGSHPIDGWTTGELQGWQPNDDVPFRIRLALKESDAGTINITTMQDYSTTVGGSTVLAIDSASNFYVGYGPDGSGPEGNLTKVCESGSGPATASNPCYVSVAAIDATGDPSKIQYSWSVYFNSSEVGLNNSNWALYWTAHLNAGADGFPGPNGKISSYTSETGNHSVDIKLAADDDHDGVTNDEDHCNNTPYGEYVNHHHGDDYEGCGYSDYDYDHDGVSNGNDNCPNTLEQDRNSVDSHGCSEYTLSINIAGSGSGSVGGAGTYAQGTTATATETPNANSTFSGWSGDCDPSGQVVMNGPKTCTANFTLKTYTLAVNIDGASTGSGTVGGGGTYDAGTLHDATASANTGSTFTGWSGDCTGTTSPASVMMDADKSCTATFTLTTYNLTLSSGGTGGGTVSATGGTGGNPYNYGDVLSLTATPNGSSTFTGWSGDCTGITSPVSVTMDANKSCTATFTLSNSVDLGVSEVRARPSPAAVGQTVTLSVTVTNSGGATASNFEVDLYKNLALPPVVGQAGDITCNVSSLAAGASTTCSGTVTYSAVGSNVVWAMVDTQNTVSEINENNNTGHVGMAVMLPDLDVLKVTVPTSNVTINQPITISATVQNTGAVDVIGAFEIDLYQNLASAPGAQVGDVNCNVNSLAALATTTCTGTVTYATAGSYTVWAQADTMNTVAESNETNNTGHVGLTVALPDLMLTRVTATPSTGTAPQVVTITATIKNASGVDAIVPFNVDLYQNLASAPGVSDVGDATCTVDSLAATASTTCSATVTYETAGTYQVWGQVDTMNAVTETDESNNVTKGPSVRLH